MTIRSILLVAAFALTACGGSPEARWLMSCDDIECENADYQSDHDDNDMMVVCSWNCVSVADTPDKYVRVWFVRNDEGCFEEAGYHEETGRCDD